MPDLVTQYPWCYDDEATCQKQTGFNKQSYINLFVMWGGDKLPPIILHDLESTSILGTEYFKSDVSVELKSKPQNVIFPEFFDLSKGDILLVPTGAGIDTYLYWNGRAFVYYFPPNEIP